MAGAVNDLMEFGILEGAVSIVLVKNGVATTNFTETMLIAHSHAITQISFEHLIMKY